MLSPLPISVQLYSVRHDLERDLPGTIERIAQAGFDLVEPYNFHENAQQLRAALAANGLQAPSGHAPVIEGDTEAIFEAANLLGITTVVQAYVPPEFWTKRSDIERTAEQLNEAAALGAQYGVRVGYHNHEFEIQNVFDGRTALEVMADSLDDRVIYEIDMYWVAFAGRDPRDVIGLLGDRVRLLHVKDGPLGDRDASQNPLGTGKVDVEAILRAAPAVEVGVVELDTYTGDVVAGLAQGRAFLRDKGIG